jgi:hypothetical protein
MMRRDPIDRFLRDCERVNRLGQIFAPPPKPPLRRTQTLQETSPGVFTSVDDAPPSADNLFGRLREQLEGLGRADDLAAELGRKIRRQVR